MNNPFQEQFLKAGIVNKQQVQKAKQAKHKKTANQQQRIKKAASDEQARLKAKKAAEEKAAKDRSLNKHKQEQAAKKAISIEINQLITNNCIKRDEKCEVAYNFEHRNKVNRIYINAEMKAQIIQGKLGIARIEGRYELVPFSIAQKIKDRNEKRIVIFEEDQPAQTTEDDPYAEFQIPDDLTW